MVGKDGRTYDSVIASRVRAPIMLPICGIPDINDNSGSTEVASSAQRKWQLV
jgi:hypothetical protein